MQNTLNLFSSALSPSRDQALGAMERLSALTHLVASAEYLVRRRVDDVPGALTAGENQLPAIDQLGLPGPVRRLVRLVAKPRVANIVHGARIAAAAGLLAPTPRLVRAACNGFLAASTTALYPRNRWGSDGSDQVVLQTQSAAALARLCGDPAVTDVTLWYIALQSLTSYSISGWIKLFGQSWRDTSALRGIMRTRTYGFGPMYRWSVRHPRAAAGLTHSMLAAESLAPLVLVSRGRLTKPFLTWALSFHASNAVFMGLGRFFTAFASMHPAIAYVTAPAQSGRRDSLLPRLTTLAVGITVMSGLVGAVLRRRRTLSLPSHAHVEETRRGNRVVAEVTKGHPGGPLVVFEAGLMTTSVHYELLRAIVDERFDTLTYARPGYGASRRRCQAEFTFAETVDDLEDLLHAVARDDRPLVFVGHSLGGYLAGLHAERHRDRTLGVVYLDSMHPGQIARSPLQASGAEAFNRAFAVAVPSMRAGWGALLSTPGWSERIPGPARRRALDEYRDARLWAAGRREWKASSLVFENYCGALAARDCPALVISASDTLRRDPAQGGLHHDLATAHPTATEITIPRSTHDSIITDPDRVAAVAAAVIEYIDDLQERQ